MGGRRGSGTRNTLLRAPQATCSNSRIARGVAGPRLDASSSDFGKLLLSSSRRFRLAARRLRQAQSSMEYLLITGFVLVIIIAIIAVAYSQSAKFSTDVSAAQIQKIGNGIGDAVNAVYYAGPPTKKTLTLQFPTNINYVALANQSIVFNLMGEGGSYDYVVFTQANMTGWLRPFSGIHVVTVESLGSVVNVTDG